MNQVTITAAIQVLIAIGQAIATAVRNKSTTVDLTAAWTAANQSEQQHLAQLDADIAMQSGTGTGT